MWTDIKKIIKKSKRFVITSHVEPDGDALGSELALYHFLKSLGKKAIILNSTKPGKNFAFMGKDPAVRIYQAKRDQRWIDQADAVFIVDISEWGRLGLVGKKIRHSNAVTICIDHHICSDHFVDYNVIDTNAGSTGELVYRLIKQMQEPLNSIIAKPLYISAMTDTGSFRYSNTSPATHLMVADLLHHGVDPLKTFNQIYEQRRLEYFRLLGEILLSAKLECHGKLAWAVVTQQMCRRVKAQMDETEGFAEILRTIRSVDVSILFRQSEKNKTRVSLRSKETADVHAIAKKLGGGGHKRAAGITLDLPLCQAVPIVLGKARQCLKKRSGK